MTGPYDDIINLPHPTSAKHPRMPLSDLSLIHILLAAALPALERANLDADFLEALAELYPTCEEMCIRDSPLPTRKTA